ncbi:hypothetical protein IAW_01119 [Bacillus cereus str. Schrouff]|uniref:hypothetical protein n=1 Tax=Bacillus cereus TaxID=1396 RepID=UPI00032E48F6|nr:hypothetical protein [Bacillus cereus]EOO10312.1 hypothetical protein IAW_01119 [Bacillus cereus str. Schrouff]EOO88673.1 hypothetical protein IGY_01736 [Bacillus cereus K-5975c]
MDWSWVGEGIKWIGSLTIFTVGTATITGIIGYLFKKVFEHMLNKETEVHKAILNQQTEHYRALLNQQTEQYKAELQKINNRHHITFSKLHVDRAETIKNLYVKLVKVYDTSMEVLGYDGIVTHSIGNSIDPSEMRHLASSLQQDAKGLKDYFYDNRIYFSEEICELLDKILGKLYIIPFVLSGYNHEWMQEIEGWREEVDKIPKEILSDIPELQRTLEKEFRKLLGVIEE